jgi:hypothetical protein
VLVAVGRVERKEKQTTTLWVITSCKERKGRGGKKNLAVHRILCYPTTVNTNGFGSSMLKEHDGPKEPAEKRATRKWANNQLRQKIIASKIPSPVVIDPKAPPAVATVIKTERPKAKSVTRFENRFKKEIRAMLDEHKERNLIAHLAIIQHQRRRLLLEKIRRLEVSIAEREGELNG